MGSRIEETHIRSRFPGTSTPHCELFPSRATTSKGARGRGRRLKQRRECLALRSLAHPQHLRLSDRTIVLGEANLWGVRGAELTSSGPMSAGSGAELPITYFAHKTTAVRNVRVGTHRVLAARDKTAER